MTITSVDRTIAMSLTAPSIPRLRTVPTDSHRTLLDGAWWPRSTDPVAELPGVVLAMDKLRGPVTQLLLSAQGWDSQPRRLSVTGRVLRLGYFNSQPASLLTALCDNGNRVDLLIVSAATAPGTADAAMLLAATAGNLVHAEHILAHVSTMRLTATSSDSEDVWEDEGGRLGPNLAAGTGGTPNPATPTRSTVTMVDLGWLGRHLVGRAGGVQWQGPQATPTFAPPLSL